MLRQMRAVLAVRGFRRLSITLALSSLGDWLGLLATALIAQDQVTGSTAKGAAFGGVVVIRLLPALLLAPLAGVFADRFDRRVTMVVTDIFRFALFASIPLVGEVGWTLAASFIIEIFGMFWIPAKEAAVPNLVRKDRLEAANQISLFTTYGLAPIAASILFAGLATSSRLIAAKYPGSYFASNRVDVALFFNALTFLVAAVVVIFIPEISGKRAKGEAVVGEPSIARSIADGWVYVRQSVLVRGMVLGISGALAAGGIVVGVGKFYATSLGGGDATFGLLFGALFVGLGSGMGFGPKLARDLSRRRWFGLSIMLAGAAVVLLGFSPFLATSMVLALVVGLGAGMAYLAGLTMLGSEITDEMRGRIFALVQSLVRVVLLLATAVASVVVGIYGAHTVHLGDAPFTFNASRFLLMIGGALAVGVGVAAFRQMDDKRGVPVIPDIIASLRGHALRLGPDRAGRFIVFEGGEGVGKSTQIRLLADFLARQARPYVVTHEPGSTKTGALIRQLLLHTEVAPSPRAEALLYAADRADHVDTVIRPALDSGQVVVCDRFIDSSLAYQGAGRALAVEEVERISRWASQGLRPDLVVLLDLDPAAGLSRAHGRAAADRLERESLDFHQRVRKAFLDRAEGDSRYLVLDASLPEHVLAEMVQIRLASVLPPAPVRYGLDGGAMVPDGAAEPSDGAARPVSGASGDGVPVGSGAPTGESPGAAAARPDVAAEQAMPLGPHAGARGPELTGDPDGSTG